MYNREAKTHARKKYPGTPAYTRGRRLTVLTHVYAF